MISNSRRRSTKIPQKDLHNGHYLQMKMLVQEILLQQISIYYKQRFVSISGSTKITQEVSDGENETQKRKGAQVSKKSNLDTIDITQTQNKKGY